MSGRIEPRFRFIPPKKQAHAPICAINCDFCMCLVDFNPPNPCDMLRCRNSGPADFRQGHLHDVGKTRETNEIFQFNRSDRERAAIARSGDGARGGCHARQR